MSKSLSIVTIPAALVVLVATFAVAQTAQINPRGIVGIAWASSDAQLVESK